MITSTQEQVEALQLKREEIELLRSINQHLIELSGEVTKNARNAALIATLPTNYGKKI